jgi:hypothetical protein
VHFFKNNVSLKLKNRIRISSIKKHRGFCKPGKVQKTVFLEPVEKPMENPIEYLHYILLVELVKKLFTTYSTTSMYNEHTAQSCLNNFNYKF